MTHPFIDEINSEEERLKGQLITLTKETSPCIIQGIDQTKLAMQEKESKLTAITKHRRDNFIQLINILEKDNYCPFCFVFHNYLIELKEYNPYGFPYLLHCPKCSKKICKP